MISPLGLLLLPPGARKIGVMYSYRDRDNRKFEARIARQAKPTPRTASILLFFYSSVLLSFQMLPSDLPLAMIVLHISEASARRMLIGLSDVHVIV